LTKIVNELIPQNVGMQERLVGASGVVVLWLMTNKRELLETVLFALYSFVVALLCRHWQVIIKCCCFLFIYVLSSTLS
jgi:hypothetical protein